MGNSPNLSQSCHRQGVSILVINHTHNSESRFCFCFCGRCWKTLWKMCAPPTQKPGRRKCLFSNEQTFVISNRELRLPVFHNVFQHLLQKQEQKRYLELWFMTNIQKPCLWLASCLSGWLPAQPGRFTCLHRKGVLHAEEFRMANRRLIPA